MEQTSSAALGPDEPAVRPHVWMVRSHNTPNYWIPFLHEPVDALKDPEREVVRLHWPEDIAAEREACASECERMVMYPGGRQEASAHDNVWAAARAIRERSNA